MVAAVARSATPADNVTGTPTLSSGRGPPTKLLGQRERGLRGDLRGNDGELVAADAGTDVAGAPVALQGNADRPQDEIARVMSVQVVDELESVEVEHDQR